MLDRREFIAGTAATGLALSSLSMAHAALARSATPEGFHRQDWFHVSSFDLRQDLQFASDAKKRLVLLWEQKGCPYCRKMHEVVFRRGDIVELIRSNFVVIQMDLWGSRNFVDLFGETKTEEQLARSYFVRATPTTLFFEESGEVVFSMPGYAEPPVFKGVYQFALQRAYKNEGLMSWLKKQELL